MADTKDQILVNFQAFTGLDDFDVCSDILAQHDWNLELAVNSVMDDSLPTDAGPSRMVTPAMAHPSEFDQRAEQQSIPMSEDDACASGPSSSTSFHTPINRSVLPSRMLNLNVEYQNSNIRVILHDYDTVGRIKELLEAQIGVPKEDQELKGLAKQKVDDSTVLRDLCLPRDNVLHLVNRHLMVASHASRENCPVDEATFKLHGRDDYEMKVVFVTKGSKYNVINLNVKGSRTIGEVKHDLYNINDVEVQNQVWSGFPANVTDDMILCESGVSYPHCEFEVKQRQSPPVAVEQDMDSDCEIDHVDEDTDDLLDTSDYFPVQTCRRRSLMAANHQTEADAVEQFSSEFERRYGEMHPVFFMGSLDDAIKYALLCSASERKLLALYLHHDNSIQVHVFCSQLLCSESIVNFLTNHFVIWPWDLTHSENAKKLVASATAHFGTIAAQQVCGCRQEELPAIVVMSRSKASNEVIDVIQGHVTLNELLMRFLHAVDVFTEQQNVDIAEEKERVARERIKLEQDMAYQESLQADRKKAETAKEEEAKRIQHLEHLMTLQREEMQRLQEVKAVKEAIQQSMVNSVPEEPSEHNKGAVSCLRFRVSGGKTISRRFWAENTIQDVLNYLTVLGFNSEEFKVLTTYPRMDITQQDRSQTLLDAKLYPQETLILEERG